MQSKRPLDIHIGLTRSQDIHDTCWGILRRIHILRGQATDRRLSRVKNKQLCIQLLLGTLAVDEEKNMKHRRLHAFCHSSRAYWTSCTFPHGSTTPEAGMDCSKKYINWPVELVAWLSCTGVVKCPRYDSVMSLPVCLLSSRSIFR